MIKVAIYTDGPTIPDRTDVVKFAFIYDTDKVTPADISESEVVIYKVALLATGDLIASGDVISPSTFLSNIDKFTYTVGGGLVFLGGDLTDNRKISSLDESIPLSCLRANTVINFGRL